MRSVSRSTNRVATLWMAALALAGCGGAQTQSLPVSTATASQIAPEARRGDLLYISSFYSSEVQVYSYPRPKLVSTLTGFEDPQGMCADKAGDVFVANTDAGDIIEYAHGDNTPIKTLQDTNYYPYSCSVDPTTGNLAVANVFSQSDEDGNVVVYAKASGTGTAYAVPGLAEAFVVAYDGKGNLFVNGHPVLFGSGVAFLERRKGGRAFKPITLPPSLASFIGWMQWDGTYLAMSGGGSNELTIDRLAVERHQAIVEGTVKLTGGICCGAFWIQGPKVTMVDGSGESFAIYKYPAGNALKTITDGLDDNSGVTVSVGPR
jgi:hypothetical protein